MTRRVKKDTGTLYQLPPGKLWWCCRYSDGLAYSESLFTHEDAATWFGANVIAQNELRNLFGSVPDYQVSLYAPD